MRRTLALVAASLVLSAVPAACGSDTLGSVDLFDRSPVPAGPDRTADPAGAPDKEDGQYWAVDAAYDGGIIEFTVVLALFGATCETELSPVECPGGVGIVSGTPTVLGAEPDTMSSVTVVGTNRQNYAITGAELQHLVAGSEPASEAPDDYSFAPYPFLVTVRNGIVTTVHQVWVEG